jgi:hypothetical protein
MAILKRASITGAVAVAMTLGVAAPAPAVAKTGSGPAPHSVADTTTPPSASRGGDFSGGNPLGINMYVSQENGGLLKPAHQAILPVLDPLLAKLLSQTPRPCVPVTVELSGGCGS